MGNYFSSDCQTVDRTAPKKRKRDSDDDETSNEPKEREKRLLLTPRSGGVTAPGILERVWAEKKKLKTTSKYIYDTFFVNGTNSDVTITALDHKWKLHKVYLKQSGYFSSMLSGAWRESEQNDIDILIPDQNIDKEALDIAFGSLYQDDVSIKPCRVVSVLAAATLLQLDGLIQHCSETMEETISAHTVCSYHHASLLYGLPNSARSCKTWLERNLMTTQNSGLLKAISPELMSEIVSSSDLFVMQVEMDVYSMLKKWAFLQMTPNWPGLNKHLGDAAETYLSKEENKRLLRSVCNRALLDVFRNIRLRHIINDVHSANILLTDGLLPKAWLRPVYCSQWHQMLAIEQGVDKGPNDQVDHDLFLRESLRCGRVLHKDGEYCWRWTGYNYGSDLLVTYAHRLIIVKRNTQTHSYPLSVSLEPKRSVMLRCTVVSFDQSGRPKYTKCSGIMTLSLGREGEAIILSVDRNAKFPLHISMNLLFYTPDTRLRDVCEPSLDEQTLESRSMSRSIEEPGRLIDESASNGDGDDDSGTTAAPSTARGATERLENVDSRNHRETDEAPSIGQSANQPDNETVPSRLPVARRCDLEESANYSEDEDGDGT